MTLLRQKSLALWICATSLVALRVSTLNVWVTASDLFAYSLFLCVIRAGKDPKDGQYAVHVAAATGLASVVEKMGKTEASRVDHHGHTPLMHASRAGSGDTVRVLLALGADPKAVDAKGLTALHHAACCENEDIGALSALVADGGVDVNAVTAAGSTALDAANGWTEAEDILRSAGGETRSPWTGDDDDDDNVDEEGDNDEDDTLGDIDGEGDGAIDLPAAAAAAAAAASAARNRKHKKSKGAKPAKEGASAETDPAAKLSWTQWGLVAAVILSLLLPMLMPLLSYLEGPPNLFAEVCRHTLDQPCIQLHPACLLPLRATVPATRYHDSQHLYTICSSHTCFSMRVVLMHTPLITHMLRTCVLHPHELQLDTNSDGRISQPEFEKWYLGVTRKKKLDRDGMAQWFSSDLNEDGFIS